MVELGPLKTALQEPLYWLMPLVSLGSNGCRMRLRQRSLHLPSSPPSLLQGTYNYGSWLARPSASASLEEATSVQALNTYKVYVTTGSLPGADFDGDVFITVSAIYQALRLAKLEMREDCHFCLLRSKLQFKLYTWSMCCMCPAA
jgi:hypothetical protein